MKKIEPLVTVYITNHNYGKYLLESIESILNQSYQNIELITNSSNFKRNLYNDDYYNTLVLMMSSGNFDGFNYKSFVSYIEGF